MKSDPLTREGSDAILDELHARFKVVPDGPTKAFLDDLTGYVATLNGVLIGVVQYLLETKASNANVAEPPSA